MTAYVPQCAKGEQYLAIPPNSSLSLVYISWMRSQSSKAARSLHAIWRMTISNMILAIQCFLQYRDYL